MIFKCLIGILLISIPEKIHIANWTGFSQKMLWKQIYITLHVLHNQHRAQAFHSENSSASSVGSLCTPIPQPAEVQSSLTSMGPMCLTLVDQLGLTALRSCYSEPCLGCRCFPSSPSTWLLAFLHAKVERGQPPNQNHDCSHRSSLWFRITDGLNMCATQQNKTAPKGKCLYLKYIILVITLSEPLTTGHVVVYIYICLDMTFDLLDINHIILLYWYLLNFVIIYIGMHLNSCIKAKNHFCGVKQTLLTIKF